MTVQGQRPKRKLLEATGIIFLILTCLRVWTGPDATTSAAFAQIPDSGLQRKQLLEEVKRSNQLLQDIRQILTTRTFNVRIQGADNTRTDNKRGR